jgi:hypothetical protein
LEDIALTVTQVFKLQLVREVELVAMLSQSSFLTSCETSAAKALGRDVEDIRNASTALLSRRRLMDASNSASDSFLTPDIMLQYQISMGSVAEMNATIAITQSADFAETFGAHLTVAEQLPPRAVQVSRFLMVRTTTESDVDLVETQQSPNRTAIGGVIQMSGAQGWTEPS